MGSITSIRTKYIIIIVFLCCVSYITYIHVMRETISKNDISPTSDSCWLPKRIQNSTEKLKSMFLNEKHLSHETRVILLYTGLFFHPWWWRNTEEDLHHYTQRHSCKVNSCYFTYEKRLFLLADAVVFHGVDINKPNCLKKLSKMRPALQKWILFIHESPMYTIDLKPYNGLFDMTMTYMQNSDVFLPYFNYEELTKEDQKPDLHHNFAAGKTGKAVWVVSHCGLLRDNYALELEKYIDLAVYGTCAVKFQKNMGHCSDWGTECEDEIKKYKFYLAFENCFCKDYITEKYWEKGLKYGLIPVVMGAFDAASWSIPGSYIDVNDYDNVEALAKHLLYLDRNDTAYNQYFQWRYKYKIVNIDCFCKTCQMMQSMSEKNIKVYQNLADFWSVKENCEPFTWKWKSVKNQIAKSKFKMHHQH